MKVVVVGARGQLGAAVADEFARGHEVCALGRAELDITDDAAVAASISRLAPDVVINCAAYNAVDAAEDHPVDALRINALAARTLAREAARQRASFVHYGTDFIFDGTANRPYSEDDRPNPQSVYAASKMLGEWLAADALPAYVLRVESLFGSAPTGPPPKGSVAVIHQAILDGGDVKVFEDRTVSPTYVLDAARATRQLVEARAPQGIYHCVNSGQCTWLELARELARQLGIEPRLKPIGVADVELRASRPQYCALSNAKLASIGIVMPSWQDAIRRYLGESEKVRK